MVLDLEAEVRELQEEKVRDSLRPNDCRHESWSKIVTMQVRQSRWKAIPALREDAARQTEITSSRTQLA